MCEEEREDGTGRSNRSWKVDIRRVQGGCISDTRQKALRRLIHIAGPILFFLPSHYVYSTPTVTHLQREAGSVLRYSNRAASGRKVCFFKSPVYPASCSPSNLTLSTSRLSARLLENPSRFSLSLSAAGKRLLCPLANLPKASSLRTQSAPSNRRRTAFTTTRRHLLTPAHTRPGLVPTN